MYKMTILVAVALTALWLSWTQAQGPALGSSEEQAIRKSVDDYCATFNKGDIGGLMDYWADDADYVDADGTAHRGKDAIRALFQSSTENLKGHKLGLKITALRIVKPEVAIEDGVAELTDPEGATTSAPYTAVWVKSGDKWLIQSARDLPSQEASVPATSDNLSPLAWLIGEWVSEDKGPKVTLTSKWALDKNFIVQDYTVAGQDGADLRVVQWIGFDPGTGQIKSWTFDSRGGHGEGLWMRDGNTWHAETTGVLADGRIGSAFNSVRFVDDTHLEWRSTDRNVEGQPMPDAEVKFVREEQAARQPVKSDAQ
jgi:uncharacterized protein (TIGR02246 family)